MRRIRPWVVVTGCLLASLAAVTAVAWHQSGFLRASAANYLRERLGAEYGAQFQTTDLRGTWFPPGLSLGRVTIQRPGEAGVLTAEDVRISFNLYGVLFGRERLGRVVIVRPSLFVRPETERVTVPGAPPPPAPAATSVSAPAPRPPAPLIPAEVVARLRALLRPPFPLRVFEVVDGRIEISDRADGSVSATGVNVSVLFSSGRARAVLTVDSLAVGRAGQSVDLGRVDADVTIGEGLITVRKLVAAGGALAGTLGGTMTAPGVLALKGNLSARLENVAALVGRPAAAAGDARFEGEISGNWLAPVVTGTLVVQELVAGGHHWPRARGQVAWDSGRLSWSGLRLPLGEGDVTCAGEVDFSGAAARYRIEAEARALDLAGLPATEGSVAARVLGLAGTLRWQGSGVGAGASGSGRLTTRFTVASWPGEEIALEAAVSLDRGRVSVTSFRGATRSLEVDGVGFWSREGGFSGRIDGTVGDLAKLLPPGKIALGGSGRFGGDFTADAQGPRFSGEVHLAQGTIGALRGIEGGARLAADAGSVRITEGAVVWPGGRGSISGTVEISSGRLDLVTVLRQFSLQEAAHLLGTDPRLVEGVLEARLRLRGTRGAPEAEGEVSGRALRYRTVAVDEGSLSLSYAAGRLGINRLRLRRGSTELTFHGSLSEGRAIEGEFESPAFAVADFAPFAGLELTGSMRGRVRGELDDPQITADVRAERLLYAGFDFKGGELSVNYRGGVAAVEGWVAARENRLRVVVEPARDWRFDADLELQQFAPELVRSGLGAFPPALARALRRASFLATGRLQGSGRLLDPGSVRVDVRLDTLWLQAAGKMLQNLSPVRISWRDAGLVVEDFRLASEQYGLSVRGGGSLAAGWNLQAEGAVNLSIFKEYWLEIEDVDGRGELMLTLGGPWSAPLPEGSLTIQEAFVRVRSLPEPLEHLAGRLELRGGTLTATGLSGTMSGGSFRGGGSYQFATDRLEANVEGRLDLSLFRARIPAARELRGPVEVRLRMAGGLAAPVFSGVVDVLDAEMFLRPFPAKITHLRGTVLVEAERLEVRELAGLTGGGTVRLTGTMDWARTPVRVDAELEGKGILVSLAGILKAQCDLHLGLHGDFQDLKLAGEVRILKARYQREFNEKLPKLGPTPGSARAANGGGPDLSRLALDVKVLAGDNVWIDNRMAKIETAVALEIGGRLGAPVVKGEITGIQGEASYLSRQFRLESGSLRFVPPSLVPLLDVQASTSVGDTQILFLMDGPLNKISYHLTSLPAMTQDDLVALLTIGETRSSLARRGERASTAGAAVFTTEPLVNALGDGARSAIGLDVLQLEPVVGVNNQVSARVTLGTKVSDRLFVSYSRNLGATEDQQVTVQYFLLDYLSVWGRELRQGIYSLDLVFRYALK
ncbi:MAG: translocation/assembly module TamB domain-containing protein [Candidatus Methylomirabilia bacterium]